MPTHLFVYGTLLSDIPSSMSKFLRRRATLIGKATASGTLYDLGLYPGFVGGAGSVKGELYRLHDAQLPETLEMLDAYETVTGAPEDQYRRISVTATIGDGGTFTAQVYEYRGSTNGKNTIPKGDYCPFYRSNPDHQRFVNGE